MVYVDKGSRQELSENTVMIREVKVSLLECHPSVTIYSYSYTFSKYPLSAAFKQSSIMVFSVGMTRLNC